MSEVTKKKFTLEIEVDNEASIEMFGADLTYTLTHHLTQALREAGYDRGSLKLHNGRQTETFAFEAGGS